MSPIEQALAYTVAYGHVFSQPLTLVEVRRYLVRDGMEGACSFTCADVLAAYNNSSVLQERIAYEGGFFYLKHARAVVESPLSERLRRFRISEQKVRRARRAVALFKHFPFVRFIGIANRVGWHVAREESDIDLFIVACHNRVWFVRALITGVAALCGWRPTVAVSADRLCLSFYVSDGALSLEDYALDTHDIHFAFWIRQVLPLVDFYATSERLFSSNARLLSSYFCYAQFEQFARTVAKQPLVTRVFERCVPDVIVSMLERLCMRRQIPLLARKHEHETPACQSAVVYTPDIIKLHWTDRRIHVRDTMHALYETHFSSQ